MSTYSSLADDAIHDFCREHGPVVMHGAPTVPSLRYTAEPTLYPKRAVAANTPVPTTGHRPPSRIIALVFHQPDSRLHSLGRRIDRRRWLVPGRRVQLLFRSGRWGLRDQSSLGYVEYIAEQPLVAVLVMEKLGEPYYIGTVDIVKGRAKIARFWSRSM